MKCSHLLALVLLLPLAQADEAAMRRALTVWEQEMTEYHAAQEFAKTPEQKAAIARPDGFEIAAALWKSISAKTGEREVAVQPTYQERRKGAKPTTRKVPTYEFEQEWAVPAVSWFLCHPQAFVKALENKPRQQQYYSEALLDAVKRIHFKSPSIAPACANLSQGSTSQVLDILEKIYLHNNDAAARSNAALGLSILLANPLLSSTTGSANARAKRVYYLKQAITLAPENAMFGDIPFQTVAEELTYELRYLSVGSVPPQVKLTGLDGKETLLPQPGKAHLLFFWSPQDEAGLESVRHMISVRDRYPDLVICPIVPHMDTAEWQTQMQQQGITLCYMDNEQGSAAATYRLAQLPTGVLLNDRCRIIHIGAPGLQLQTSIDSLFNQKPQGKRGAQEETPAIQPPSRPAPTDRQAPALRDMPEF